MDRVSPKSGVPLPGTTGLTESDENFSTLRDHSYITINTKEGDITNDMVKLHGILYRNVGEKKNLPNSSRRYYLIYYCRS